MVIWLVRPRVKQMANDHPNKIQPMLQCFLRLISFPCFKNSYHNVILPIDNLYQYLRIRTRTPIPILVQLSPSFAKLITETGIRSSLMRFMQMQYVFSFESGCCWIVHEKSIFSRLMLLIWPFRLNKRFINRIRTKYKITVSDSLGHKFGWIP